MSFNAGGAASGAMSGAAMGSQIMPGWGTAAGAVIGGLAGGLGGGDSAKDAAKYQMKYYARYVLPKLQEEQRFNQAMNNQALGQYTSSGNQAMNMLTGLGTGQFGLSDADKARLAELQGMDFSVMDGNYTREGMQQRADQAEMNALLQKQAMGGMNLGGFLEDHPLTRAMNEIGEARLREQYSAAFGGQAPSSFMGKQLGLQGQQNLLNTFSAIQDPLAKAAGLGGQALGQQVGANTSLAQSTLSSMGSFGNANALGSAQAGEGAWGKDLMGGLGQLSEAYDPLNRATREYAMDWLNQKKGGIGGGTSLGGYGKPIGGFVNPYTGAHQGGL